MQISSVEKAIAYIRGSKVKGAEEIARVSMLALQEHFNSRFADPIAELGAQKAKFLSSKSGQPLLRNSFSYILNNLAKNEHSLARTHIELKIHSVLHHYDESQETIAEVASSMIKNGMVIFIYGYSTTVMKALCLAKKRGIRFSVHNTEARPSYEGRKAAEHLLKEGIEVVHYVDSAARLALKKADIFFMGANVITKDGKIINKIGSELFAEVADKFDIPIFCLVDSWKYDSQGEFDFDSDSEMKSPDVIWEKRPRGLVINNFAFEMVNPNLVTGIITELGIFKPKALVEEIRRKYPWLIA